jgi:hypothetical protein
MSLNIMRREGGIVYRGRHCPSGLRTYARHHLPPLRLLPFYYLSECLDERSHAGFHVCKTGTGSRNPVAAARRGMGEGHDA